MRFAMAALALALTLWHLWTGASWTFDAAWVYAVHAGLLFPDPMSERDILWLDIAHLGGISYSLLLGASGLGRLLTALCAAIATLLVLTGSKRRFIGGVLVIGVLTHAAAVAPRLLMEALYAGLHDYLFLSWWSIELLYTFDYLRWPLQILGVFTSFVVCTLASILVAALSKTPRPTTPD